MNTTQKSSNNGHQIKSTDSCSQSTYEGVRSQGSVEPTQ